MAHVEIKQGKLLGSVETSTSGNQFYSFKGIPYATPPVGDLRFRAPVVAGGWSGTREAIKDGNSCIQKSSFSGYVLEGDEDCLYLNVFSPKLGRPQLPVMVWFHGGGFLSGSSDSSVYGPQNLMDEDVVVVTVNYRLEVLGFLSLDTEEVPGNAGMKDQVLSLKWVRENISQFGGNPDNVTIFGQSAGGASVSYYLVSPMSKGLFHRAILQSGTFFSEWSRGEDLVEYGFKIAKHHGKDTNNVEDIAKFLKKLPADQLTNMTQHTSSDEDKKRTVTFIYCPTIEKTFNGQEAFLPKSPFELLKDGNFNKVPIIIGYNNKDGMFNLPEFQTLQHFYKDEFHLKLPRSIVNTASPELTKNLSQQMKQFYYGNDEINEATIERTIDLESDISSTHGIQSFAKFIVQVSDLPFYFYKFCFDGDFNYYKTLMNQTHLKGAAHGDDLMYVFKTYMKTEEGSPSWITMKRMVKMWTNFATFGNPVPHTTELLPIKWTPMTSEKMDYIEIDADLTMHTNPDKERYDFNHNMYRLVAAEQDGSQEQCVMYQCLLKIC